MISVLDYTRKLLHEHDCVVLPDLGGFLAYFSHAFYSDQNALYHAPQKRVAFNEALKLDDGLLAHYLIINEQITRDDAQKRIKQFVESIKTDIQEKQQCFLDGIGTLAKNDEGKLQFEPLPLVSFYQDGYGFKTLEVAALTSVVQSLDAESSTDWTKSDRPAEELPAVLPRRRRSRVALYVGGVLLIGAVVVGGITQFPSSSLQSSLNPFELVTTVKAFLGSDKKTDVVSKTTKPVVKEQVKVVTVAENPLISVPPTSVAVKEENVVSAPVKPVVVEEKTDKDAPIAFKSDEDQTFFVMAGGFSKLSNAQRLARKLQRNGYPDAQIMNPQPEEGKLILVSAVGYDSSKEAKQHLSRVGKLSGATAWILKH